MLVPPGSRMFYAPKLGPWKGGGRKAVLGWPGFSSRALSTFSTGSSAELKITVGPLEAEGVRQQGSRAWRGRRLGLGGQCSRASPAPHPY